MIKVYLKGIIGNVCIGRKAVNKSARPRSESIVAKKNNYQAAVPVITKLCALNNNDEQDIISYNK